MGAYFFVISCNPEPGRVMKILSAIMSSILLSAFLHAALAEASVGREVVKTKAVSVSYRGPSSIYTSAHKACQKYWKRDITRLLKQRATLSVEVVTVNERPKTVSALCVSRKYINDDVRRVAKR